MAYALGQSDEGTAGLPKSLAKLLLAGGMPDRVRIVGRTEIGDAPQKSAIVLDNGQATLATKTTRIEYAADRVFAGLTPALSSTSIPMTWSIEAMTK
jgi:hypothetical protein